LKNMNLTLKIQPLIYNSYKDFFKLSKNQFSFAIQFLTTVSTML